MKIATEQINGFDPVRRLIWERTREMGLTLLDVSLRIRRNQTYIHQYLMRGTPKRLPEDVRENLAVVLEVPEESLRAANLGRQIPAGVRAGAHTAPAAPVNPQSSASPVPVFTESDLVEPTLASEWCPGPALSERPGPMLAFWMASDHGRRLRRGDLAFARVNQPPRPGDAVVVLLDRKVTFIGDLIGATASTVEVDLGEGGKATIDPKNHRILRVAAVIIP